MKVVKIIVSLSICLAGTLMAVSQQYQEFEQAIVKTKFNDFMDHLDSGRYDRRAKRRYIELADKTIKKLHTSYNWHDIVLTTGATLALMKNAHSTITDGKSSHLYKVFNTSLLFFPIYQLWGLFGQPTRDTKIFKARLIKDALKRIS